MGKEACVQVSSVRCRNPVASHAQGTGSPARLVTQTADPNTGRQAMGPGKQP